MKTMERTLRMWHWSVHLRLFRNINCKISNFHDPRKLKKYFKFDGRYFLQQHIFQSIATQIHHFSRFKTDFSLSWLNSSLEQQFRCENKRKIIDGNPEICLWRFICDLSKTRTCDGGLKFPSNDAVELISIKRHSTLGSSDNNFMDFSRKSSESTGVWNRGCSCRFQFLQFLHRRTLFIDWTIPLSTVETNGWYICRN